jgi:pyrimidine deaminase RibD-like protein
MNDAVFMRLVLRLAQRGYGTTSPNPMVGAVLVKGGKIIGRGWHRRAGEPHAEIEALRDAQKRGHSRRDTLRHAGTMLHSRPHAALHRRHYDCGNKNRCHR